jgi:hypothetical protein
MPNRLAQQPLVAIARNQPYLYTIRRYIHTNIAPVQNIGVDIAPNGATIIYNVLRIIIDRHMEQIRRNEYAYDNPTGIIRDIENRV